MDELDDLITPTHLWECFERVIAQSRGRYALWGLAQHYVKHSKDRSSIDGVVSSLTGGTTMRQLLEEAATVRTVH
jgi:hypothetical protein